MGCSSSTPFQDSPAPVSNHMAETDQDTSNLFVTRDGTNLLLGGKPFRFASLNAPELLDGDVNGAFEVDDTFKSFGRGFGPVPVTRSYTLRVNSPRVGRGHINGWNAQWGDWEWDSGRLLEMDHVLDSAARHGVRLIIPIINADCDGQQTNWVGDTTDLIRYRKGIASYDEARKIDFYTDPEMINAFKLIIDKLTSRVNSINGKKYGDDPTILAWETGNELHYRGFRPAPGPWTVLIAKHLKSRAPNTLVMDGSFARTDDVAACYAKEALESDEVDLFSHHYYGIDGKHRLKKDVDICRKHNKVFIAGEYGFFSTASEYDDFLSTCDSVGVTGSLVWSLRPHSSKGGFKTHSEDHGNWSYHIPGFAQPLSSSFDPREAAIVPSIRKASYKLNKLKPPPFPVPDPPERLWLVAGSTNEVCWTGSAWAVGYQMVCRPAAAGGGEAVVMQVQDCCQEGELRVSVGEQVARMGRVEVRLRAVGVDGQVGGESEPLLVG